MKATSFRFSLPLSSVSCILFATTIGLTVGCGSGDGGSSNPGTPSNASTTVTLMLSSTANDLLSQFNVDFTGLTMTNQAGKTVNVFDTEQKAEFIHLNGITEPLLTVSVPQDTYTTATITVGGAQFSCVALDSSTNGLDVSTFAYGNTPSNQVTVNLPTPVKIAGTAMGLTLDMQVAKSATYATCQPGGIIPYSINPTFNLTAFDFSSQPANVSNGLAVGLGGLVASVDAGASTFTVTAGDGPTWTVKSNGSTMFHGISGSAALAAGMPVTMDAAVQADGSLLASSIAVNDTKTTDLSIASGPLLNVASSVPALNAFGREEQGLLYTPNTILGGQYFSFGNAVFQTSEALGNVQSLPFAASFTAANMVAGQNVSISSHATAISGGPTYVPSTTVTLIPQTINGTVTGVATDGSFDTYTIQLAPYDLMPALAVQPGQTTRLTNPATVVVYADSNTRMQNATALESGNVLRFYGLLFNDHGTLKLDCAQVNDGVTE
jgi:hypothetical protein